MQVFDVTFKCHIVAVSRDEAAQKARDFIALEQSQDNDISAMYIASCQIAPLPTKYATGANVMPRVIEDIPPVEKRIVCIYCGRTIAYVQNDVKSVHGTDISGGPDGSEWIDCPGCSKQIILRSW